MTLQHRLTGVPVNNVLSHKPLSCFSPTTNNVSQKHEGIEKLSSEIVIQL